MDELTMIDSIYLGDTRELQQRAYLCFDASYEVTRDGKVIRKSDGTCGNSRSIMFGAATNAGELQSCNDRRYYTMDAYIKPKRKRKIESIYDYE